jgi:DNA-directed RNA polymerase subunit RPC12/RpoP
MSEVGDLRRNKRRTEIWHLCPDCKNGRWVPREAIKRGRRIRCNSCAHKLGNQLRGPESPTWQGGRWKNHQGYIYVKLQPDNPCYSMATSNGYVLEHRLVMAEHLGRPLESCEIVHHKNGIRDDNDLNNLELNTSPAQHIVEHNQGYRDGYQRGLLDGQSKQMDIIKKQNEELLKHIKLLEFEVRQLRSLHLPALE